jgi:sugar porter (SP) family MFS transporter
MNTIGCKGNGGKKMKINPVLFYTLIVSMGGFIFGFDASVISGAVGQITTEFELSHIEIGFVVAAPTLGGIIATLTAGYVADRIGRRTTLMIIALLYLVSAILSALAPTYTALVAARFIGGMAFCSLMIAPMYIAEISPAKSRGRMVSVNQLNIVLGFSAAYFANYFLLQLSQSSLDWVSALQIDSATWRWMLGLEIVPAAAYFLLLFVIPKSPRWLIVQRRQQEASESIKRLYPNLGEQELQSNLDEIAATTSSQEASVFVRLKEIFGPTMRTALIIGLIVGISQQVTGVNAIYFYAPTIFEQTGIGTNAAFAQAIWVGIINVVFTLVAMALIDKLGRRPLLIFGLIGVVVSMAICAYGYSQAEYKLTQETLQTLPAEMDTALLMPLVEQTFYSDVAFKNAVIAQMGEVEFKVYEAQLLALAASLNSTLILVGILGFVACFAISLGPVMWVLFSEIFPTHLRGIAISVVGVVNSIVSFCVQLAFPWELAHLGAATTFLIYGGFAAVGLVLVVRLLPETCGKSLEELEQELSGKANAN